MNVYEYISRDFFLFENDREKHENELLKVISKSKFLVLGGAGSIGQAVVKEIFKRNPKLLHVIDISENNLVELVRDIRSSYGYIKGEFKTFAIDVGSWQFQAYSSQLKFDYVLNLTALKHVRSEKDYYTLSRMIEVNIINTLKTINLSKNVYGAKKYFCVSTDKAANPVNLMGASKRIMELFLHKESKGLDISTARFANVAFSDGSLLHSFSQRIMKYQPIVAPNDVKRYFISAEEGGYLCLFSTIFGSNNDIFFPKLDNLKLISFTEIAIKYLNDLGYSPKICSSEDEAREYLKNHKKSEKYWPCFFSASNTTGEKPYEEFYTKDEDFDLKKFQNFGIVKNSSNGISEYEFDNFIKDFNQFKNSENNYSKKDIIKIFKSMLKENFDYLDIKSYLDEKM